MQVRFYSPKQKDGQTPHHQDEIYVIVKASGKFVRGNDEISFKIGDIIFVPKKEHHYFKDLFKFSSEKFFINFICLIAWLDLNLRLLSC